MRVCPSCKNEYRGGEVFCPIDAARLVSTSQSDFGAVDPDDPILGTVLAGRYEVIQRIGEGGMGLVYEGLHRDIDRRVAIKVLRDDLSRRPDVVERFRQEAKSATRIGHENIVDVFDFGETLYGASYFVMEFLEGEDLANVLGRDGTLPLSRATDIVMQCCDALGATHRKGIVHRDMKPENIFLTFRDRPDFVKIVDFGIAKMSDIETEGAPGRKLTKTGMIFGTPEYMSPEQAAGKDFDHRVDVYALGIILYECLAGRVPFVGDTFMGILTQHLFEQPPPIEEINPNGAPPVQIQSVIARALAKDPDHRYQSMDALREAIELAQRGELSEATVAGPSPSRAPILLQRTNTPESASLQPATLPIKRSPLKAIVAVAAVALLGVVGWAMFSSEPEPAPGSVAVTDAPAKQPTAASGSSPAVTDSTTLPTAVPVRVITEPAGAVVSVVGQELGCEPSPCEFVAKRNESIVLLARLDKWTGRTEVTPVGHTTVQIAMIRPKTRSTKRKSQAQTQPSTAEKKPKSKKRSSSQSGDLKVPDIFR